MRVAIVGTDNIVINMAVVPDLTWKPPQPGAFLVELRDDWHPCEPGWTYSAGTGDFRAPEVDLPSYKKARCADIDANTEQVVQRGFVYQGQRFRLLPEDRTNILGMLVSASLMTYPLQINNIDDTAHVTLTGPADVQAFYAAAMGTIAAASIPATAIKQAVMAAMTQADVDVVVDPR